MAVHVRILAALVAGVVVGALARLPAAGWLLAAVVTVEPFGTIFIRLITMVVVPLVVAGLFVTIASIHDLRHLGRIGGRTLAYFVLTTAAAAVVGLVVALVLNVGAPGATGAPLLASSTVGPPTSAPFDATPAIGVVSTLVQMVPQNPVAAAAQGDLLPLIVAVCLFGAAAAVASEASRRALLSISSAVSELTMVVLAWVMHLAAPAVFVLMAAVVARSGLGLLAHLAWFVVAVVAALVIHAVLVLLPLIRFRARRPIGAFLAQSSDAIVLAFSTASSTATLPVTLAAASKMGLPDAVSSFLLPAGTTVNKNGAAAYKAVTAVFVAHLAGLALGPALLVTIVVMSTVAAFAGAGVPGSSLVTTLIVLRAVGLEPVAAAAIALVAGVDRPLDMCRSAVNTLGNLVGVAVVAGPGHVDAAHD